MSPPPTRSVDRIRDIITTAPLVDGHNDLLWELRKARDPEAGQGVVPDVGGPCPGLQTDLPRLATGGVGGQFWSVYVPSDLPEDETVRLTLEQIGALFALVGRHPDRLELTRSVDAVERIAAAGRVASMIGVEGGHSIGSSLAVLRVLAELGAGYLTLTHNDDTPWADSATGERRHGGLTTFGEEVVRELNRCGVLVDLSHVSDDTMRQTIEVSQAPVMFSHSSARSLCDVTRNVPDDVLELVGRTGGVVMVAFVPAFEVQVRERLDEQERHHDDELSSVGPEVGGRAAASSRPHDSHSQPSSGRRRLEHRAPPQGGPRPLAAGAVGR